MSKDPHFGRAVAFATGTILTYIFDEEDLLPEASFGVVGLLDDAYLVHGFVGSLSRMYPFDGLERVRGPGRAQLGDRRGPPSGGRRRIVATDVREHDPGRPGPLPVGTASRWRRRNVRAAAQSGGGGGRHRLGADSLALRIPAPLDAHLDAVLEIGVPGIVAVAARPGFSWERAVGVADLASGAPMTLEHRFRIASVTKLFVATAVLQLVDEGAFELDGEVGLIGGGVTVRHLLNHTSGLPHGVEINELLEPYRENLAHRPEWTPRDMLGLIESRLRLSAPGEGWFYSGSNYVVLGLLVEETTGASLSEELRRRILDPLGLADTELPELASTPAGLTRGYLPADNPVLPGPGPDPVDVSEVEPFGWGGGGMVSSAGDVARFLRALLGSELLGPRMYAEMFRTVPSDWEESDGYGLGVEEVTSLWGIEQSTCGLLGATLVFRSATRRSRLAAGTATARWSSCSTPIHCPKKHGWRSAA